MNLIVDIGNTLIKTAVIDGDRIMDQRRTANATDYFIDRLLSDYPSIDKAIVASTGPGGERVCGMLDGRVGYLLHFSPDTAVPLENGYGSPQTLGADRLASAVGAYALYGRRNMLIVDYGTAITFDVIADGVFLGGNISLGLGSRLRALHEYTAKLPLCEPTDAVRLFGTTTESAIEQGAMSGIVYETEGYIAALSEKYEDLCIIFTGGDAKYFVKRIKNTIFANCDLTVCGLNIILEYNAAKISGK